MKPRYIAHTAGSCPVDSHTMVCVIFSNGNVVGNYPGGYWARGDHDWWKHEHPYWERAIIAYRVIEQENEQ